MRPPPRATSTPLDARRRSSLKLRKLVLGLKQVGSRSDAPYNRATGAGFVAAHNGQYADALSKGVGVSLLVAETTGALAASFMTILRLLARQTRLPGATDNTRYGEGRASAPAASSHTTSPPTTPPPSNGSRRGCNGDGRVLSR